MELLKQEMELFYLLTDFCSKKILLQKFFYTTQRVQTKFEKQEIELSKQEMELF